MELVTIVVPILILVAFGWFLYKKISRPTVKPQFGDQPYPRDATPEEIADYWRNRGVGE